MFLVSSRVPCTHSPTARETNLSGVSFTKHLHLRLNNPMSHSPPPIHPAPPALPPADTITPDGDDWNPVVRYIRHVASTQSVIDTVHSTCPECSSHVDCDDTRDHECNGSHLYTNGSVTVCENPACEYETMEGTQIKRTQFDRTIGPFQDTDRDRYEHTPNVILYGGFPHAHDYGYNYE